MKLPHRFLPAILSLATAAQVGAADWPQLLGPNRDGVADEKEAEIAKSFPADGPKVLWRAKLGTGFAGPAVADGKVIVFHRIGDEALVQALDATSGKELWKFSYTTDYVDSFGFDNGPRATPTIASGKVVVHGADGVVHALDLKTGAKLWHYDTVKELASPQGYFGRACAPLFFEGRLILAAGGRNTKGAAGLIALDAKDGSLAWQSVDDEAAYSSPVIRRTNTATLVCWMRNQLVLCNAADGKVLDSLRFRSKMDASVNAAVPVWGPDDRFFVSACYGVGAAMFKQTAFFKLAKTWAKEDALDCHYSTPVYFKDHLYGFHGRQEQGQALRCIRVADGGVAWESPRVPGGALLRVKDTLVVVTEAGEMWLVEAAPEKFNQLASAQILHAGHRSFPAFANGVLYARDGREMVAVDLKAP